MERPQAIRAVRDELLRLERLARVSRHAFMLAHAIRNPLAVLSLKLELELDESPDRRDAVRPMLDACELMSALLDELFEEPELDPAIEARIDRLCAPLLEMPIDQLVRR